MSLRFDHAIILVHDLQKSIAHYHAQGFNPFFGGEHAGGKTHNALIVFADGSYLELLAPTSPALLNDIDPNDHTSFLFLLTQSEGLGGYALLSGGLEPDVAAMQGRGLGVTLSAPNGRARPDGKMLRWRTAALDDGTMTPFFIQDETPRVLRVPDEASITEQPNGTTGVAALTIGVPELAAGIHDYEMMTGIKAQTIDDGSATLNLHGVNFLIQSDAKILVRAKLLDIQLRNAFGDAQRLSEFMP